jgi:hypothetical protein
MARIRTGYPRNPPRSVALFAGQSDGGKVAAEAQGYDKAGVGAISISPTVGLNFRSHTIAR